MDTTHYQAATEPGDKRTSKTVKTAGLGFGMFILGTFVGTRIVRSGPVVDTLKPPTEMQAEFAPPTDFVQYPSDTAVELLGFASWSTTSGAKLVSGDFNGDGKTDAALIGGSGWNTIPVATSNGDGTFTVSNCGNADMASYAQTAGAQPVVADFDGDGKDDIALTGGHGWNTVPVAFSVHRGCFANTNLAVSHFPDFAATEGAQAAAGDFNGDGKADILLSGLTNPTNRNTMPVAFGNGDGTFRVTNERI